MALSQSAVPELLEAFRTGEGVDLIRELVRMVMQELIEAEAAERIGAGKYERTETRAPNATAPVTGCWPPKPAMSSRGSPSCTTGRTSQSSSNDVAASTRRSMRS
jgi:hypothetical protein